MSYFVVILTLPTSYAWLLFSLSCTQYKNLELFSPAIQGGLTYDWQSKSRNTAIGMSAQAFVDR